MRVGTGRCLGESVVCVMNFSVTLLYTQGYKQE